MERQKMDVKQAAEYLGVCTDTIYTMVKKNEIPHFRIRRRILFSKEAIESCIKSQEEEVQNQINVS